MAQTHHYGSGGKILRALHNSRKPCGKEAKDLTRTLLGWSRLVGNRRPKIDRRRPKLEGTPWNSAITLRAKLEKGTPKAKRSATTETSTKKQMKERTISNVDF